MQLSLIGMSGSGKSHWSKKLVARGFKAFHCDDLIEEKLAGELARSDGTSLSVGEWMGFPFDADYTKKESRYLSFENSILAEILYHIHTHGDNPCSHLVIDTTGSVVYVEEETLKDLQRHTTVVHLETPSNVREQMLAAYLVNRRPVLWRGFFSKAPDETNDDALARCYTELLSSREHLYRNLADITIDYAVHSKEELAVAEFIKVIHP